MRRLVWICLMLGCDDGAPGADPVDGALVDAATQDDGVADAAAVDATPADARPDDAQVADGRVAPDMPLPDAAVDLGPDACVPDCAARVCGDDGCGGTCGACDGLCEAGVCARAPSGVIISEILAANSEGPDWIELQNRSRASVDLTGWFLTDDLMDRQKWTFPALTLGPGGIVVLSATGDDDAPGEVSFRLRADGEPLALVWRDGETIVDAFDPAFPPQRPDISYGVAQIVTTTPLIAPGASVRWRVPDGPDDWTAPGFDDGAWAQGPTGIGYSVAGGPGDPADAVLLSAGRPTAQTSTLGDFTADRAVNGDPGDFTHTDRADEGAEWRVDLEDDRWIGRIVAHNRRGCCGSRLRDITVRVLDGAEGIVWESPLLNPENALGSPATLTVEPGVQGRIVVVHRTPDLDLSGGAGNADEATVLSLGEVEVFGSPDPLGGRLATPIEPAPGLQLRARFDLADPATLSRLALTVTTDAGFVVWLNGQRVAALRAPEDIAWDSRAVDEPEGLDTVTIALPLDAAQAGMNTLAIQALSADDADLFLLPTLVAETVEDGERGYFDAPTPGAYNATPAFAGFVSPVRFDVPLGIVDGRFDVTLSADPPDAEIRYSLDGTDPGAGPIYDGPLSIERSTSVRAVATHPGFRDSPATSATWIILDDVAGQTAEETLARGFPARWGGVVPDYGIDPRVVDADRPAFDAALRAIPTVAITVDLDHLFGDDGIYTHSTRSGVAWERPAAVEILPFGDAPGVQINCGLRIQGGAFRNHNLTKKHSLRLLFKGIYGPTKLEHPVYPDADAVDRFDTLTLRANSNDGWQWSGAGARPLYIRDAFGRATRRAMGGVASHGRFAHVYLNGIYWGMYEITERPDAAFASSYFGGDKADWDALNSGNVVDGDALAWRMLLDLARGGLAEPDAYAAYTPAWIDAAEYADYMLTNLFVGNTDWPHKNYYLARDRVSGAGFYAFMWDSEWSMGLRSDLNTDRTGVSRGIAEPWAALKQNPEFRVLVGDRAHRHLFGDGALTPARTLARFDALAAQVEVALVAESARWGDQHAGEPYTVDPHWRAARDELRDDYFPERSAVFLGQLRRAALYPAIDGPVFVSRVGEALVGDVVEVAGDDTLFFTIDGSDPRLPGGEIAPNALEGPIEFRAPGVFEVRARFWRDGAWSALEAGRFTVQ